MKLLQNSLKQAEFTRTVWAATPEPGTTLADLQAAEYWAHVSKNFKPGDQIEIFPPGGEWFATLYVRSVAANAVQVFTLNHVVFGGAKQVEEGFDIKHRGGAGWGVVRKSDRAVLVEKLETRQEAEAWLAKNNLV